MDTTPLIIGDFIGYITTALAGGAAIYFKSQLVRFEIKTKELQDFFNPDKPTPNIPDTIPPNEYIMQHSVKRVIMAGKSPDDRISLLEQIDEAESLGKWAYTIKYSKGYYYIKWGLIAGGDSDNTN